MLQKFLLVLLLVVVTSATSYQAFGTSINFDQCYTSQSHHCYSFSPQLNQNSGTNEHVEIHLPANGAQTIDGILSPDNFTSLKANPAVMAVVNIYTTTASPTLNYCPNALYILQNQGTPEYLNKFYDVSKGLDLTGYVYPAYCYVESGNNPINGNGSQTVPEFGPVAALTLAIAVLSLVVFTAKREIRK